MSLIVFPMATLLVSRIDGFCWRLQSDNKTFIIFAICHGKKIKIDTTFSAGVCDQIMEKYVDDCFVKKSQMMYTC